MLLCRYPSYIQCLEPVQVSCAGEISDGATQLELTFSTGGCAATEANTFICGDTMSDMKSIKQH